MAFSPAFQKAFDLCGVEPAPADLVEQMATLQLELTDEDEKNRFGDLWSSALLGLDPEEFQRQYGALPSHLKDAIN